MRKNSHSYCVKKLVALTALSLFIAITVFPSLATENYNVWYSKTCDEWSEDVQLTNLSSIDHWADSPVIGTNGDLLHVIYNEIWQPGITFRRDLRYLRSTDCGKTWESSINLTETNFYATSPDVVVENNNIYVVWYDYRDHPGHPEIYFKNSSDSGQTWQNDTALPTNIPNNDGIPSQKPHIGVWNNTLHVIWEDCRDDFYHAAGEIYYMRSLDRGITWDDGKGNVNQTQRLTFSGIETSSGCCEPTDIAVYGNTVHVVGTQIRPTNERVVVYLNSLDNGQTWSNVTYLSPINDGYNSACGSLAVKDNNMVHGAFSDDYYGVVYRNFTILNDTWSDIVSVHPSAMTDVQIVADCSAEKLFITFWSSWRSYYVISYDNGNWYGAYNLSEEQAYSPQFAVRDGYVHAVFTSDRTGNDEIYYKRYPKFNDPPEINEWYPLTNVTITELQNQLFYVNATDPNNDTLTYQWYLNDTPLTNETNCSYTFIPGENFSGDYSVKVSVSDGEYFANHTWTVTVINVKQLQETINNLQTQLQELNENYADLSNALVQLAENLSVVRNQLNLSNQNNTVLQNLINSLNQTLNMSNEQITMLWESLNQSMANETEFRNLITQLNQSINSLQGELNKLREENERVVEEREAAEERLMIAVIVLIGVILVCVSMGIAKRKR